MTAEQKPIISTMINTTALALTSFGVLQITTTDFLVRGYLAIFVAMFLEYGKYLGMKRKLW